MKKSKLAIACEMVLEEWAENIEKEYQKEKDLLPQKTPEQMKAEAQEIWKKAHNITE